MDDKTPFFKGRLVPPMEELGDAAFRLLCHLCDLDYSSSRGTRRGFVFPRDESLAAALDWGETKLKTALRCLEDHNYIRRIRTPAGRGRGVSRVIALNHERAAVSHAIARALAQGKPPGPDVVTSYQAADAAFEERVHRLKGSGSLRGRKDAGALVAGARHAPASMIGESEQSHAIAEPQTLQSLYGDRDDALRSVSEEEERIERRTPDWELKALREVIRTTPLPPDVGRQRSLELRSMGRLVLESAPSFDRSATGDAADAIVRLCCRSGITDESELGCALTEAVSRAIAGSEAGALEVGLLLRELPIVLGQPMVDADVCVTAS